jgi:ATP-dependent DNA helicase UvrD/PcrA
VFAVERRLDWLESERWGAGGQASSAPHAGDAQIHEGVSTTAADPNTNPQVSAQPKIVGEGPYGVPVPGAPTRSLLSPDALLDDLDPEQRQVATTLSGPVAVIAGAGTGKTRAITYRIAYGVATGAYNPTSVLAVTFTTRAAGELRGRLQQLDAYGVQARTFHSAALRQAQHFWPQVHGGELPRVLDNRMPLVAEAASRLRVRVDTPGLRDLVAEVSWAKVSNVSPEDYPRLAVQHNRHLASYDSETVSRVFAAYENAKRDRNRIDFEDILLCAAALISEHPEIAETIRRTYRHLVVDEYQDVSPLQEALLNLWRGDGSELCVVGDPAQTIHSFAGAQPSYLTGFGQRFPQATVIRLVRDYRSTPQVVRCANSIMAANGEMATKAGFRPVTLQAQRPAGPDVEFVESADESVEAAGVADWLTQQAAAGVVFRDMAVLFRINAQSPPIEQALADRNIPYLVRGGERFYERPEVRQALLTLRTRARAMTGEEQGSAVEHMKEVLITLGWTPQPPEGAGALRERWESLAALLSVAEDLEAQSNAEPAPVEGTLRGHPTLQDVSAELDRRAEAQHVPAAQGVTVSTLHSAKGLEWDAVALLGIHEGSLPFVLASSAEQVSEEQRLLYVGITRARRLLRVSWARTRNGNGQSRAPSRFLQPVLSDSYRLPARQPAARRRNRHSALSMHCRSCGRSLSDAAERKMGRHLDCPATYNDHTMALLREWRRQEAAEQQLPAYCVFTDATLIAVAEARPSSMVDLIKVQGLGKTKADKYGEHLLAIIATEAERTRSSS